MISADTLPVTSNTTQQAIGSAGSHSAHQSIYSSASQLGRGGGNSWVLAQGSSSGKNEGMEARIAKLETAMEYVQRDISDIKTDLREIKKEARTDFRLLFGALVSTTLGLAALMAKGFGWL